MPQIDMQLNTGQLSHVSFQICIWGEDNMIQEEIESRDEE